MIQERKAELWLLLITLIWGSTFVITKNALDDASPLLFIAARFTVATLLFVLFFYKKITFNLKKLSSAGWIVSLMMLIGFSLQTVGLKYTSASHSGFITGLLVIFTPIFQVIIERRLPTKGVVIGVIMVAIGLYLLVNPRDLMDESLLFGDFLTLLCAIAFAVYIVMLDVASKKDDIYTLIFAQLVVTSLGALMATFILETPSFGYLEVDLWISVVYLALMATIVATFLQTKYQKDTTPAKAAVIFTMEPVFSAVLAFLVLGEMIGLAGILGGIIIVSGLVISEIVKS